MTLLVSWLITALVVVLLIAFALYVIGLRAVPLKGRPPTPTYDRWGQLIGLMENPDYRENPGEEDASRPTTQ